MTVLGYSLAIIAIILFGILLMIVLIAFTVWMIYRIFNKYGIECIEFNMKAKTIEEINSLTTEFFKANGFDIIIDKTDRITGTFVRNTDTLESAVLSIDSIADSNVKINPTIIFDIILNQVDNDVNFEGYFYVDLWYGSNEYKFGRVQKLLNYIFGGKYVNTRMGYKLKLNYFNKLGIDKRTMKKFTRSLKSDEIWNQLENIDNND